MKTVFRLMVCWIMAAIFFVVCLVVGLILELSDYLRGWRQSGHPNIKGGLRRLLDFDNRIWAWYAILPTTIVLIFHLSPLSSDPLDMRTPSWTGMTIIWLSFLAMVPLLLLIPFTYSRSCGKVVAVGRNLLRRRLLEGSLVGIYAVTYSLIAKVWNGGFMTRY
jgi:hypothetical protein